MPITATDIEFRLSINDGPGNSEAQPDPNDSIGGFMSTTDVVTNTLHNLFDVITGDENAASEAEYRNIFIFNDHASLTWQAVKVWLSAEVAGGAVAAIALDGTGVVAFDSASPQSERVANENTAPSGETFSAPTTKGTGLSVGDLDPDEVIGLWVRRTAANTAAVANDGVTIRAEGDTAA